MSETTSPVPPGTSWAQCTCPECQAGREETGLSSGCPCPECQPGPGIDHTGLFSPKERKRRERLVYLVNKDTDTLTDDEAEELEGLLRWSVYRM